MLYLANIFLLSLLGVVSSYTDITRGIIQNKVVFPMVLLGIVLAMASGIDALLFFINLTLAFFFGFALYLARLWSAADGKLFLAFASLFPAAFYSASFAFFPAFSLILNSFIPAFVVMLVLSLAKTSFSQKRDAFFRSLEPRASGSLAVIMFAFYWLLFYVFSFLSIPFDFFLTVLLIFLFVSILEKAFPRKLTFISAALSAAFALLNLPTMLLPGFWIFFGFVFVVMVLLRFFIIYLGFFAFGKRVEIDALKPGMVLLEGVYERNGLLEKKKLFFPSLVNAFQDIETNYAVEIGTKGLSKADIGRINKMSAKQKARFHSLLVQETIPFAPLLFIGTLLTFFCPLFLPWC